VCQQLGLDLKTDPGGFATWDHILRGTPEQQVKARNRMVKYCKNDVLITTQLYDRLLPWIDGLNVPLFDSGGTGTGTSQGVASCTRCGGSKIHSRGWAYATATRYKQWVGTRAGSSGRSTPGIGGICGIIGATLTGCGIGTALILRNISVFCCYESAPWRLF
jgi:hypothetical protein